MTLSEPSMSDSGDVVFGLGATSEDARTDPTLALVQRLQRIGPYAVSGVLGSGAMGVVVEGRSPAGDRVAIKLLRAAKNPERFQREISTLRRLRHPNLVGYVDSGRDPRGLWLAMPMVDGRDLHDYLRDSQPPPDVSAAMLRGAALGVAAAHAQGVVHRDLKPANLFLRVDGQLLVGDFGLAVAETDVRLTRSGVMLGTLAYMAPEQLEDPRTAGPPADVWSLGAILFRLLAGRDLREDNAGWQTPSEAQDVSPRALNAEVPAELDRLCQQCLDVDPRLRPTASELAQRLSAYLFTPPPPAAQPLRVLPFVLLASFGVVLLALVAAFAWRAAPPEPDAQVVEHDKEDHDWELGTHAAPRLEPLGVWSADGRRVQPLDLKANASLFAGEVTPLSNGRLRVNYSATLAQSLRVSSFDQLHSPNYAEPFLALRGDGVELYSPDNTDGVEWRVGRASWSAPEVTATFEGGEHVDRDLFRLSLGKSVLNLLGRQQRVTAAGVETRPFSPASGAHTLRYAPQAVSERLRIDGALFTDTAGAPPTTHGSVSVLVAEARVLLNSLVVSGVPLATDRYAWATIPHPPSNRLRGSLVFRRSGPGVGGPAFALRDPSGAVVLEAAVHAARLELRVRGQLLASRELPARVNEGKLHVERTPDLIRVRLTGDAGPTQLEVPLSLPVGNALQLAYGSRGPALDFGNVTCDWEDSDPVREAYDAQTVAILADPIDPGEQPLRALRRTFLRALLVVRHDVALAYGVRLLPQTLSEPILGSFASLEAEVPAELAEHSLVWRCWLAAVAPNRAECLASAEALIQAEGRLAALERFRALRYTEGQSLWERLTYGYCLERNGKRANPSTRKIRELSVRFGLLLATGAEREALVALHATNEALRLADLLRRTGELTPAARTSGEQALRAVQQVTPTEETAAKIVESTSSLCLSLGHYAEGLAIVERYQADPTSTGTPPGHVPRLSSFVHGAELLLQLKRPPDAVELLLAGIAQYPRNGQLLSPLAKVTLKTPAAEWEGAQGLRAVGLHVVTQAFAQSNQPQYRSVGQEAQSQVLAASRAAGPSLNDRDLGAFARALAGTPGRGDLLLKVERPFAILTRAQRGDPGDLARVAEVADTSRLARSLVRISPSLRRLLPQ